MGIFRNRASNTFVLTAVALLFLALLNMTHVGMIGDTEMGSCPSMPGMAMVCTMNPLEHVASISSMFEGTAAGVFAALLMLVLALAVFGRSIFFRYDLLPPLQGARIPSRSSRVPQPTLLQELFSSGLLHPKAF